MAEAQVSPNPLQHVQTASLDIAYEESGPADGPPAILLHGFPYDARAFDGVVPPLVAAGWRVLVPYLRGFGETRFLSVDTLRSGQQAAVGKDVVDFMDALGIPTAALAGFDWGGRAATVVAALWPERVRCLVSVGGYTIYNVAASAMPSAPEAEYRSWYMYYFQTERGKAGLSANRAAFCRLLWQLWSPTWHFSDDVYARTAASFENPDFVDVAIHRYRHSAGAAPGDPAYEVFEARLAERPIITAPTISLQGTDDGVTGPVQATDSSAQYFKGPYERRVIQGAGHDLPQENPAAVVDALHDLIG
ncbi:MAG: alpha/beta hydrolase [Chloroflexi bacterium]|nr:alpha/beta hydrolase [Chloroflexota bacterium]